MPAMKQRGGGRRRLKIEGDPPYAMIICGLPCSLNVKHQKNLKHRQSDQKTQNQNEKLRHFIVKRTDGCTDERRET